MDRRDELEQQIWEFVYGLLPDDEADALRRRIAADAEAARLYDEVRRKAAILAQAAKLELPPIPLAPPAASVRSSARRWTNWAVALAASLLLCYLGLTGLRTRTLERSLVATSPGMSWSEQSVRTVVYGPATLQPSLANYFAVQTQTADGVPRAAAVDYRVFGEDGTLVTSGQVQSDASGFAQFNFRTSPPEELLASPRFRNVHLELEPQMMLPAVTVRRTLPLAARELTTYLSADKTVYRPGEAVRCRSVTLDRATLQVLREVPVEFLILDAAGQELRGARREVLSQHGVAFADFELPRFQLGDKHTLVARSPTDAFPEARREFAVRPYATPTLRQKLDFARDSYELGAEVEADLSVKTADDGVARGVPLAVTAEAGGQTFLNLHTATDDRGAYRIRFRLPDQMPPDEAVLHVTAGRDVKNRISEVIPIRRGTLHVEFFPESGELVEGVSNRVYCFAHDAQDRPVHVQGRVIDGQGDELAAVQTIHDGRGTFVFRPQRGESYRLELDPASGAGGSFELPPISDRQFLVLDAAPGVFAAQAPLTVRLRTKAVHPVAVSATCRGLVVGQEFVSPTVFQQNREADGPEIVIPLAETAEGVIRLTAYDYSVQPPVPVAERLVFRRPGRQLAIRPEQELGQLLAGDAVQLAFSVQDERGRPLSAVLGAAVVDEAALSLARDRSASLTTHFWLTSQIDDVRGLEDANVYLADGSSAEQALDLLLGTQGWRRFVRWPADRRAGDTLAAQTVQPFSSDTDFAAVVPVAEPAAPAVLADNATEAAEAVRSGLNSLQNAYALTILRGGRVLVIGSLILVVMLGLLAVMRRLPATTVWLSALGTSALCLVLGGIWLAADRPQQEHPQVSVAQAAADVQLAEADEPAPPQAAAAMKQRTASEDESSELQDRRPADGDRLLLRQRKLEEQAESREELWRDMAKSGDGRMAPAAEVETTHERLEDQGASGEPQAAAFGAAPAAVPEATHAREAISGRAAGMAGAGEPSRRSKNGVLAASQAESAAPRPAAMKAASAPAEPPDAVREPPPAPAASPPMPSPPVSPASSLPSAPVHQTPHEAAVSEITAQAKEAEPAQQRYEKKAEQAPAAALPDMAAQVASDASALLGSPADEMGGISEMEEIEKMSGFGGGLGASYGGEAAAADQMFRQYAPRGRREIRSDEGEAPRETACWEPLLLTDAQGRASIQFRLPEAATTYRVLIDGHAAGRIGSHLGRIVVQPQPAAP